MIAESMPAYRRGFWTSFTMLAGGRERLAAGAIGLVYRRSAKLVRGVGWRIPFSCRRFWSSSAFFAPTGVEESPLFLGSRIAASCYRRHPEGGIRGLQSADAAGLPRKGSETRFLYLFSTFLLLAKDISSSPARRVERAHDRFCVRGLVIWRRREFRSVGRRPVLLVGLLGAILAGFGLFALSPRTVSVVLIVVMVCLTFTA